MPFIQHAGGYEVTFLTGYCLANIPIGEMGLMGTDLGKTGVCHSIHREGRRRVIFIAVAGIALIFHNVEISIDVASGFEIDCVSISHRIAMAHVASIAGCMG